MPYTTFDAIKSNFEKTAHFSLISMKEMLQTIMASVGRATIVTVMKPLALHNNRNL